MLKELAVIAAPILGVRMPIYDVDLKVTVGLPQARYNGHRQLSEMLKLMQDFIRSVMRFDPDFSREQWLYVFAGVVAVGFFAMRGFGSRTNY
jgi:hypothetical protein